MKEYKEETKLSVSRGKADPATFPLDDLLHSERIKILVDELVSGKSKHAIICEYAEKWNFKPKTIKSMINEAVVYLHQIHAGNTVEEMRSEQVSKLEDLYKDATISEKLKIIDLVSSTLGLYDNKLTVKQEDEIKINLGI